jgi:hypothetical protein
MGSAIPPGAGFSFMAVAQRSLNWPASNSSLRAEANRHTGFQISVAT